MIFLKSDRQLCSLIITLILSLFNLCQYSIKICKKSFVIVEITSYQETATSVDRARKRLREIWRKIIEKKNSSASQTSRRKGGCRHLLSTLLPLYCRHCLCHRYHHCCCHRCHLRPYHGTATATATVAVATITSADTITATYVPTTVPPPRLPSQPPLWLSSSSSLRERQTTRA